MSAIQLGVYDPAKAFDARTDMAIDSWYIVDWNASLDNIGNGMSLTAACNLSASRSRTPMVTVQPVANPKITKNRANLLQHIAAGRYDSNTRNIAAAMKSYGGPAYIRWGPEMDDPSAIGNVDWAVPTAQAPDYIAAYHRRTNVYKSYTNALSGQQFIWSPMGTAYSNLYFPGYSFCDLIGGAVFGWSLYVGDAHAAFRNQMGFVYAYLAGYNLPMIVEIGGEASDDQAAWADGARASFAAFPLLRGAVWYSAPDLFPWVPGGPVPNFTTTPAIWHA